jgi:large subunit ribosomal protein L35
VAVPADAHTSYVPPHPHRGTKYHRYVLLLLPQPEGAIDVPTLDAEQRAHFDVRAFCAHYALDGAKGGGAHMWRAVWSEDVSKMYGTRLGQYSLGYLFATTVLTDALAGEEPRFGRPRKPDPYVEVKRWSKYAGTPLAPPKMAA